MDFNTDGASLDNSGRKQIWPIQCRIANLENTSVGLIGIYRRSTKPTSTMEFCRRFVEDVNRIVAEGGIFYHESEYSLVIRAFIADAPARAFLLCYVGHNATQPCSKCKISGQTLGKRMSYEKIENVPRTDGEYFNELDEEHQHAAGSPLSHLPMGPVSQVPFDPMHLLYLGVMKRMLMAWVDGKFSKACKLRAFDIRIISDRLKLLFDWCPSEFARSPHLLERYGRWKATELQQFLLYSGAVVLYGILPAVFYDHFLLLSSAARVLVSSNPSRRQLTYARMALKLFVVQSPRLYSHDFVTYNVHGLLHLVDDVEYLGPADEYSTFSYENAMKYFRRCIRKPHLSLQQIANRRAERARVVGCRPRVKRYKDLVALYRHDSGPLPRDILVDEVLQFRRLKSFRFILTAKNRNRYCLLKDFKICIIENIIKYQNNIWLIVKKFESVEPFFDVGISSSDVGYFKCKALSRLITMVPFNDVLAKCYAMPLWAPRRFDKNGRESLVDGTFIVATMNVLATY